MFRVDRAALLTAVSAPHLTRVDAARLAYDEFRSWLATPAGRRHGRFAEAWNAFTGATPTRCGTIPVTSRDCPECHGSRFSTAGHSLTRAVSAGYPLGTCAECYGSGRGTPVVLTAAYLTPEGQ